MISLTKKQKDLLIDFYFGCGSQEDMVAAAELISINTEAANLYAKLENLMAVLKEPLGQKCPDSLVESTIARIKGSSSSAVSCDQRALLLEYFFKCGSSENMAQAKRLIEIDQDAARLYATIEANLSVVDEAVHSDCPESLVSSTMSKILGVSETESTLDRLIRLQRKNSRISHFSQWSTFAKVAALAAMVALVVAVYLPGANYLRERSYKAMCKANLNNVSRGLAAYAGDNLGASPLVKSSATNSWWRVGDQNSPDKSATSNLWLMVKGNYVKPEDFLCPGNACHSNRLRSIDVANFSNDFPNSNYVDYSFRIVAPSNARLDGSNSIIAADSNPMFDDRCDSRLNSFKSFVVTNNMLRMASKNHASKGQNLLYRDGSVEFNRNRLVGGDDIYTIRGTREYNGSELPSDKDDVFLIP